MTRPAIAPHDAVAIQAALAASRQAADAICDRWSLAVVLAAFLGDRRFGDFADQTGMGTRLLTARLRALETIGVMIRVPYSIRPPRHEYHLTPMGTALFDVLAQMLRWEQGWGLPSTAAPETPTHTVCGAAPRAILCCRACGAPAGARDIDLKLSRAQLGRLPPKQTAHRRSTIDSAAPGAALLPLGESLDIFGDKWGIEILLCAFFRVRRFNDFRAFTGIAANVLTDRLDRFVAAGILARAHAPSRTAGYWLTPRGVDLYGIIVAVQDWADEWLRDRYRSPVRLIHRGCGQVFHPLLTCTACNQVVRRGDLRWSAPAPYANDSVIAE